MCGPFLQVVDSPACTCYHMPTTLVCFIFIWPRHTLVGPGVNKDMAYLVITDKAYPLQKDKTYPVITDNVYPLVDRIGL